MFRTRFIIFYIFQVLISCNINNTFINKYNIEIEKELIGTLFLQIPKSYSKYLTIYDVNEHYHIGHLFNINSNNFILFDSLEKSFINIRIMYPLTPLNYFDDFASREIHVNYGIRSDTLVKKFPFNYVFDDFINKPMFQNLNLEDKNYKFNEESVRYNPILKVFTYKQTLVTKVLCKDKMRSNYGIYTTTKISIDINSNNLNFILNNFYGKNFAILK